MTEIQLSSPPLSVPTVPETVALPSKRPARRKAPWVLLLLALAAGLGGAAYFWGDTLWQKLRKNGSAASTDAVLTKSAGVISVNTVKAVRKTLVRQVEQAGSILPQAQAEL